MRQLGTKYALMLTAATIAVMVSVAYAQTFEAVSSAETQLDGGIDTHSTDIIEEQSMSVLDNSLHRATTPPKATFSLEFPSSVAVNEPFEVQYTFIKDTIYGAYYPEDRDGYNTLTFASPEVDFINFEKSDGIRDCYKTNLGNINDTSDNIADRTSVFTYQFNSLPTPNFTYPSITIFGSTFAEAAIAATHDGNGRINLNHMVDWDRRDAWPCVGDKIVDPASIPDPVDPVDPEIQRNIMKDLRPDCINDRLWDALPVQDMGAILNDTSTCQTVNETTVTNLPQVDYSLVEKLRPDCIHDQLWYTISADDRNNILNNQTTCQIIDGTTITNLPLIGYQHMPKVAFEGMEVIVDQYDSVESFIRVHGFTDPVWIEDFTAYYNNATKQADDFSFQPK